jgi:signal recognition particle GTPase
MKKRTAELILKDPEKFAHHDRVFLNNPVVMQGMGLAPLVVVATTGQNGLIQARTFKETAGLTGIVLTKLDGTAKGGIVIAIARELGVPVKFAGVGEGIDDLKPFDARSYVEAII